MQSEPVGGIQPPQKTEFLALDGVRGIAAICVVLYHYGQSSRYFDYKGKLFFGNADLAVDLFFILSGFVLCYSYAGRLGKQLSVWSYLLKRLIRLYPMHLFALGLGLVANCALIANGFSDYSFAHLWQSAALNALYLPFPNASTIHSFSSAYAVTGEAFPLNPPAWSLFFEMVASFLFIFLYHMNARRLLLVAGVSFVAVVALSLYFSAGEGLKLFKGMGWDSRTLIGGFPRVMFGFCFGMALYKLHATRDVIAARLGWLANPIALYALVVVMMVQPFQFKGAASIATLLVLAPLVVILGAKCAETGNSLIDGASRFLGWISYPLYCLHYPVGKLVYSSAWSLGASEGVALWASFGLSLIMAAAVAVVFDGPIRIWLATLLRKYSGSVRRVV